MAYTKRTWHNGEIITAEKLNSIENGVDCLANCSNLWTNAQPESEFPAQDVTLDTTVFRVIEICFLQDIDGKWMNMSLVIDKRRAYKQNGAYNAFVRYGNYERAVAVLDDKISFGNCKYGVNYNGKLIPYSIHAFE